MYKSCYPYLADTVGSDALIAQVYIQHACVNAFLTTSWSYFEWFSARAGCGVMNRHIGAAQRCSDLWRTGQVSMKHN